MTNLKKINVNQNAEVGVVRTDKTVGDPQKKWEAGSVEQYVDSEISKEETRAINAENTLRQLYENLT